MKKSILLMSILFFLATYLSAQVAKEKADEIVLEYLCRPPYTVYANKGLQTSHPITTISGEVIELDYSCWVYYISNTDESRYLIVNESNGNLLEVNPKNNGEPENLAEWRRIEALKFECSCWNEIFYYYGDEKIYLHQKEDMIFIQFTKDAKKDQLITLINSFDYLQLSFEPQLGEINNIRAAVLETKDGKPISTAVIDFFKKQPEVIYASYPLFVENERSLFAYSDEFLITLNPSASFEQLQKLTEQNNCTVRKMELFTDKFIVTVPKASSCSAMQMSNIFHQNKILFANSEPNFISFNPLLSNDKYFSQQWTLDNTGQNGGTPGIDIRAEQAWAITKGKSYVRIAVLDQGVDLNHPDLKANMLPGYDATGYNSGGAPEDNSVHGTACAGIVGAVQDNKGISGVAPNCKIMPVRILVGSFFYNISTIVEGIKWAWENGADVISNSWRYTGGNSIDINNEIINAVTKGRSGLGCVVVFGSGNENMPPDVVYPAYLNSVISVGSINNKGIRVANSSYGDSLDVVAPSESIYTTGMMGNNSYTILNDGKDGIYFSDFGGTSAACPQVAGIAALVISANPLLTGIQVRNIIESRTQKVNAYSPSNASGYNYSITAGRPNGTWHPQVGYGLVNAYAAVQEAQALCNTPIVNFTNQTVTVNQTVTNCGVINVQDVTVVSNAKLKLVAPEVNISGPFEIYSGSELEI